MENKMLNENANINDELLEDVSGGVVPESLKTGRCYVCGNLTPNLDLVDHHLHKVCKKCLKKLNNK